MKKNVLLLVFLLLSMSLFAKWSVGQVVDDFDDPTGEEFVYTLIEGTFANSATSNSKACIRVLTKFSANPYPEESWEFEIHDYNWDNPVDDYYDDSSATIKIKDDNGKVTTFKKSNSEYAHTWNILNSSDGHKFTQLLKDNNSLKVNITIENSKYVFTIDCRDFTDMYDQAFSKVKPRIGYWEYNEVSEVLLPIYESLKELYKDFGIDKLFPNGSYEYYGEKQIDGKWYLFYFNVDNEDFIENGYITIDLSVSELDKSYPTPVRTKIESDQVKEIYLIAGNEQKKMIISDGSYTWSSSEPTQEIINKMASNKSSGIKVVLKNGKSLTFTFDGPEFANVYEKAKKIDLF